MPKPIPRYRKIPGRAAGLVSITQLWLGDDHLLLVNSTFGIENYRRFAFRDIEALIIQRTSRRLIWNSVVGGVSGILAAACALIWLSGVKSGGAGGDTAMGFLIFLGIVLAMCVMLLLFNTLRGAACAVFIQSAVGLERLGIPRRLPRARRLLRQLQPLIEAAQATTGSASIPADAPETTPAAMPS